MHKDNYNNIKDILRYFILKNLPEELYSITLMYRYKQVFNEYLNLNKPLKLSEKIQWLKLYDNSSKKTILSDKIEVKTYINKLLPDLKYAEIYQKSKSFKGIDFTKLPKRFVLKTNNACKTNVFVENKDKLSQQDIIDYKRYFNRVSKINYAFYSYFEMQYKDINPQIFAEEYIYCSNKSQITEYEVYCFNSKPEFIRIIRNFNHTPIYFHREAHIYDINYNELNFSIGFGYKTKETNKSDNFYKIKQYAEILAKDFKFVRIDFMEINSIIYFGEMTFTPYSGYIKFFPEKYDLIFGEKLNLI